MCIRDRYISINLSHFNLTRRVIRTIVQQQFLSCSNEVYTNDNRMIRTISQSQRGSMYWKLGVGSYIIYMLSLIHISEPTRLGMISYAVFCLKKKNQLGHRLGMGCRLRGGRSGQ
eukprot:TRINITY_DN822_c0_g3_i2.p1 TRINITY_DN822_c0_g3~~TRINITY_DN822_c0_g3_i2.p1  ORF type:complete len:115 (+),score=2.51 TRINITY_DN822_c0_g3_i2:65-409(+)